MKTKKEIIKEAWGETGKVFSFDEDGWSINTFNYEWINKEKNDIKPSHKTGFHARPKSLRGIENNNGWTKVEDDLPKENSNCLVFTKDKNKMMLYWDMESESFTHGSWSDWDNEISDYGITHYKVITDDTKPLH